MGVYIKGMEMPSEQYGKMVITLYPNGHVAEYIGDIGRVWEAIPVPQHGRLIDVDALAMSDRMVGKLMMFGGEYVYTQTEIDNAPTIIEAEEDEV